MAQPPLASFAAFPAHFELLRARFANASIAVVESPLTAGNGSCSGRLAISAWAHAVGAMGTHGCRIATSDPHLQASHTTVPCAQLDQMLSDADPCTLISPSESSRTWLRTLGDELRTGARRELRVAVFGGSLSGGSLTNQSYVTRLQAYLERGFSSAGLVVRVTVRNFAAGGTGTLFFTQCFEHFDAGSDDVLVSEFTLNEARGRYFEAWYSRLRALPRTHVLVLDLVGLVDIACPVESAASRVARSSEPALHVISARAALQPHIGRAPFRARDVWPAAPEVCQQWAEAGDDALWLACDREPGATNAMVHGGDTLHDLAAMALSRHLLSQLLAQRQGSAESRPAQLASRPLGRICTGRWGLGAAFESAGFASLDKLIGRRSPGWRYGALFRPDKPSLHSDVPNSTVLLHLPRGSVAIRIGYTAHSLHEEGAIFEVALDDSFAPGVLARVDTATAPSWLATGRTRQYVLVALPAGAHLHANHGKPTLALTVIGLNSPRAQVEITDIVTDMSESSFNDSTAALLHRTAVVDAGTGARICLGKAGGVRGSASS